MKHQRKRFTEGMLDTTIILNELNLEHGQTVVDAGCGTGYMARLFSREVGAEGIVHALDVNETYINEMQGLGRLPNVEAKVCDITSGLPLMRQSVDLIYVSTVLHSRTPKQLKGFVSETKRVLKRGGILAVVEIAKRETPFGPPLKQRYSPEELQAAIDISPRKTTPVAEHFYMQTFQA